MALLMVPQELLAQAKAAGIDVMAVAGTVRSLTIRARKPGRSAATCC
jgi:post-segregation antitoxin (ccd killing protein)